MEVDGRGLLFSVSVHWGFLTQHSAYKEEQLTVWIGAMWENAFLEQLDTLGNPWFGLVISPIFIN